MADEGLAAAYLTSPVSIAYLTGFRSEPHERLLALVVNGKGATLVVPALDGEKARAGTSGVGVTSWQDGDDPYRLVAAALGVHAAGRLGVDKGHLTLAAWERLRSLGAGHAFDIGAQVRRMRARKSPQELDLLRRAADATGRATERLLGELRPGITELEVATVVARLIADEGGELSFDTLVQSGPNSALPHLRPGARRLEPGDLVLLDFGAAVGGYRADTTRTVVLSAPDPRQREVHAVVLAAHDAAVAAVRSGVTVGEVDEAARSVIRGAGLGERFIHRVGHGLGLEAHEDPSLDPGGTTLLEAGMVVTVEPGVYLPGWGGIRIEDDLVVEEDGACVLTHADRSLRAI